MSEQATATGTTHDPCCDEPRPCSHERSGTVMHNAAGPCEPGYHRQMPGGGRCRCGKIALCRWCAKTIFEFESRVQANIWLHTDPGGDHSIYCKGDDGVRHEATP